MCPLSAALLVLCVGCWWWRQHCVAALQFWHSMGWSQLLALTSLELCF